MTISDMARVVNGNFLLGEEHGDRNIKSAFCSDLMSPHVIRTSEMLDLKCILFVRGKVPSADILESAEEMGMTVITTGYAAFTACGLLYEAGLRGIVINRNGGEG